VTERPRFPLALLLVALGSSPALAGTRVDLDGPWQFRVDDGRADSAGWSRAVPADVETVDVPHTWGVGLHAEHEGVAWYWRTLDVPAALHGRRLELHFGATFYAARVFVNGQMVGEHEGGHTAWFVDVTKALGAGGLVAVRIDNRPGLATIPGWAMKLKDSGTLWYDWWHYGGIVRDVALVAEERAAIRRQEIRPVRVEAGRATVATRVFLERFAAGDRLTVDAQALDPSGRAVARAGRAVDGAAGATVVGLELLVPEPQLWHFDRPSLYRMVVQLTDAKGAVLDRREESFGIRTVEIRDRGLWLNGERVRLTGMTRHEESTQEGLAETRGTMKYDWDDMKALHVVFTRPVHYPQHPYVLDYADRNGVLLVPEIPMWQFSEEQMKDPKVLALAKRMMKEMIDEAGNHPSVFAWSVCNESATSTPGGRAYVKAMVEHVKALDPDRFVSYADDGLGLLTDASLNANQYTDFLMMNQYFGSWHGPADGLAPALDRLGKLFPDRMVVVSEFGLAGPFAPDTAQADVLRVATIRGQLAEFAKHDFVAGAVFWCYQDYRSHRNLWPGETSGWVEMGLVDENRQRHPSYDVWKEETSPARLAVEWTRGEGGRPAGFKATVARRSPAELPSYELRGYRFEWEARDQAGALVGQGALALPAIGAPATVEGTWPASPSRELRLSLRVLRPTGFVAAEKVERWWEPVSGGLSPEEAKKRGLAVP
jgi:beta-glucuronidase